MKKIILFLRPEGYWTNESVFFLIGWMIMCLLLAVGAVSLAVPQLFDILPPCYIHELTGLYCPGCGGTRAVRLLFHADVWNSFIHHPAVPYMAVVGMWFMITQTLSRLTKGKVRGMKYHHIYVIILVALYVINCVWKNVALIVYHVRIIT